MSFLEAFRERRPFPGQDPWVVPYEGTLLLVQSSAGNRRIVIKQLSDLDRMDRNTETVIWAPTGLSGRGRQLWAPELHPIEGRWFVYFAASDGSRANHRMYALVADHPLGPYRALGQVYDPANDVWAIDLTVFTHDAQPYAIWSGWDGPDDGFPQNLYIAPMANPWTISGERRCLSRPQHGWEMSVAPVNEGPTVLRHPRSGGLFVLYAADASWSQAYKTGLLAWTGGDVADPASWQKRPTPFFPGGGHGCVAETSGGAHFVYHRKIGGDHGWTDREIRHAPLSWDGSGFPVVRTHPSPAGAEAGPGGAGMVRTAQEGLDRIRA